MVFKISFYLTAPSYSFFFVSAWQILQWYCRADKMGITKKHLPTWWSCRGERRRDNIFKTTFCL